MLHWVYTPSLGTAAFFSSNLSLGCLCASRYSQPGCHGARAAGAGLRPHHCALPGAGAGGQRGRAGGGGDGRRDGRGGGRVAAAVDAGEALPDSHILTRERSARGLETMQQSRLCASARAALARQDATLAAACRGACTCLPLPHAAQGTPAHPYHAPPQAYGSSFTHARSLSPSRSCCAWRCWPTCLPTAAGWRRWWRTTRCCCRRCGPWRAAWWRRRPAAAAASGGWRAWTAGCGCWCAWCWPTPWGTPCWQRWGCGCLWDVGDRHRLGLAGCICSLQGHILTVASAGTWSDYCKLQTAATM